MNKPLFYHIADVIQKCRTWVKVVDTHETIEWNYCLNGEFRHINYQVITLSNYRRQFCWQKTYIWKVNEHDLADAVRRLIEHDPSAKKRVHNLSLTYKDVDYIILKATHDILKLELYEFDD